MILVSQEEATVALFLLDLPLDANFWCFVKFLKDSRVQNWGPVRDSGARSIEGVFL